MTAANLSPGPGVGDLVRVHFRTRDVRPTIGRLTALSGELVGLALVSGRVVELSRSTVRFIESFKGGRDE